MPDNPTPAWALETLPGYVVRYRPADGAPEHVMDFEVYEIMGEAQNGEVILQEAGLSIRDIDHAERYLHGHVKWDGCSNWSFDEQDRCMLHFCGMHDVENLKALFARMYAIADEQLRASIINE